ncbi:hypothetical protein ACHWQZ_G000080 [Mnemiopsis leidyi]
MPRRTVPLALFLRAREAARETAVSPTPDRSPKSPEGEEQECSRSFSESDLWHPDSKAVTQAVRAGKPRAFEMTDAPHLSEAQVTEFREAFAMFDKDGDGSISVAELGHVMRSLGQNPTDHELTEMIREADDDNNGSVDFEEFLLLMSKKMSMLDIDQELLEAFSVFDKDGNGFIDQDELTNVLASLGEDLDEEQVKEMMRQADKDGDGLVSFEEFKDIMCSKV